MNRQGHIQYLKSTAWAQCPPIKSVNELVSRVGITNITRGSGTARARLDLLEYMYRASVSDFLDISDFKYCYFVNGVTDAINQWIATESRKWQYYRGDYEYPKFIDNKGIAVRKLNDKDVVYISNPSAIDGNFCDIAHITNPVILDCAYLGSTATHRISVPSNTEQIWFSFSKGWGLIGQRLGLVFSKHPHVSLDIMKSVECWNYTGVEVCIKILENYLLDSMFDQYRSKQLEVCYEYDLTPSDCFFIATSEKEEFINRRRRAKTARLNLYNLLR